MSKFDRVQLTDADASKLIEELIDAVPAHMSRYGAGIFTSPHEIVGCMFGQHIKLSASADESIYTGDLSYFRHRCMKTLLAACVGLASVDKIVELRSKSGHEEEGSTVTPVTQPKIDTAAVPSGPEPEGIIRDESGKVVAISGRPGLPGYDPELSKKEGLRIFCNGEHVPTAYAADARSDVVMYLFRNEKGRIREKSMYGKVEIKGL